MVGPLEGFADVWGTAFLKQVCGFDRRLSRQLALDDLYRHVLRITAAKPDCRENR